MSQTLSREAERERRRTQLEAATLNALHELAIASGTRGLRAVARLAVDHARSLVGVDAAAIFDYDEERRLLVPVGETESSAEEAPVVPGEGAIGLAFETGLPVLINDYQRWEHAVSTSAARGMVAAIAVPLISGERPVGALGAWTYEPRDFTAEEEQLLMLFAAQVAPALEAGRLNQQRENGARIFETLHEMAVATGGMHDPQEVARLCVDRACQLLGADSAVLVGWDEDRGVLVPLADNLEGGGEDFKLRPGQDAAGIAYRSRGPVVINDYQSWRHASKRILQRGIRSVLCVPLLVRDRAVGALEVMAMTPREFVRSERDVLTLLASQIAPALEATRLIEKSGAQVRELRALHDVAVAAGGVLEPGRLAAMVVNEARSLLGADRGVLRVWEPVSGALEALADTQRPGHARAPGIRVGEGLDGLVYEAGRAMAVENYPAWSGATRWGIDEGFKSAVSVPLVSHRHPIGTLAALTTGVHRNFSDSDIQLLSLLAAQVAPALEAARLANAVQQRARILAALHDLAVAAGDVLEPERVATLAAEAAVELVEVDRVTVAIYDEESGLLRVMADTEPASGPPPPAEPGRGSAGKAFATRAVVRVGDYDREFETESWARDNGFRSSISVPLEVRDQAIGSMTLLSREARVFDDDTEDLVSLLVAQVAPTIEAARLHASLAASERALRAILESALDCIIGADEQGSIVEFNPAAERVFGRHRRQALGRPLRELLALPDVLSRVVGRFETTGFRDDGSEFPVEVSMGSFDQGDRSMLSIAVRDLTEQHRAEAARRESEERFRAVFDRVAVGIARLSLEGMIIEANPALYRMLGLLEGTLNGVDVHYLLLPEDRSVLRLDRLASGDSSELQVEVRYGRSTAGDVWGNTIASSVRDANGEPLFLILMVEDITLRKAHQAALEHRALHDPLTDLPNRSLLQDRLNVALASARRERAVGALLLVDLDGFKQVNDFFGHHAGDALLQQIGARMRAGLRGSDTVARLGGDEFAVVLPDIGGKPGAMRTAVKLHDSLEKPFSVDGHELHVSASIGVALFPTHSADAETLMRQADAAMYSAKRVRAGSALYDPARDSVD